MTEEYAEQSYATGKRKESIAKVWLQPGNGTITVNGKSLKEYFCRESLSAIVQQPILAANGQGSYDIIAKVRGGGLSGQSGAMRLGIARALIAYDSSLRPGLKRGGFLTRDSRSVERKKYGQPGARKRFQFSKR